MEAIVTNESGGCSFFALEALSMNSVNKERLSYGCQYELLELG